MAQINRFLYDGSIVVFSIAGCTHFYYMIIHIGNPLNVF